MVQLFEQAPCPALRPFIQRFLVVKFPFFHRDAHLPDTRPVAAFSFRGQCPIDGDQWATPAAFTGLRQTLRVHEHCHEHAVLLATFTAGGRNGFSASVAGRVFRNNHRSRWRPRSPRRARPPSRTTRGRSKPPTTHKAVGGFPVQPGSCFRARSTSGRRGRLA